MTLQINLYIDPGGGGDYTSFSAAEAAEQDDLVGGDLRYDFILRGGSGSVGTIVLTDNATWNPGPSNFIKIYAQSGSEHDGTYDVTTAAHVQENANPAANITVEYTQCKNFIIHNQSTAGTADCLICSTARTGTPTIRFENMIFRIAEGVSSSTAVSCRGSTVFVNCVMMGGANSLHTEFASAGSEVELYHCTLAGGSRGILLNDADVSATIKSCYAVGVNTIAYLLNAGSASTTKLATNDASGDAGYQNIPFTAVTLVSVTNSGDFDPHVADTDSALYDAGDDESANNGGLTEDYEGGDRDAVAAGSGWDIGADEFGVARGDVAALVTVGRNVVPVLRPGRRAVGGFF